MKKFTITLFLTTTLATAACAQSSTPLALYSGNQLAYNPAYAGLYDLLAANLSIHQSWSGLPGAPSLINLNSHMPLMNNKHAVGMVYQHETQGPLTGNSVAGNYAYKVLFNNSALSLGLQAGLQNTIVDWDRIEYVDDDTDLALRRGRIGSTRFEASVGAYYTLGDWYVGASAMNLGGRKYAKYTDTTGQKWYLEAHAQYYLMGGYNYVIDDIWSVRPEVFCRYTKNEPFDFSFGAFAYYTSNYAAGLGYSSGQNTLNFSVKVTFLKEFRLGYSYGYSLSSVARHLRGSHEISINFFMPISEDGGDVAMTWM